MKHLHQVSLAALALAMMAPAAAQAATDAVLPAGWYAGAGGLFSQQLDADSKIGGVKNQFSYDAGWGLTGFLGRSWSNGLRAEGEVTYRHAGDPDKVSGVNAGSAGGHIRNISVLANGYYDIATGTRFTPYVGAGVGVSVVDAFNLRTVNGRTLDSERTEFAYQGIAGVTTAIDNHWSVVTDYRYFATTNPDFKSTTGGRARTENASHNVVVGFRYSFGAPEAPAAAPLPRPAQAVPPAPAQAPVAAIQTPVVPQSFLVFFDFDRATLTPEAKRIIAAAAQEFKQGKYVRLVVTGNTDTVGTAKYNQALSLKRAKAVQAELVKEGVAAGVVDATGVGENNLRVPTANGVREAQNRRAEIVLKK